MTNQGARRLVPAPLPGYDSMAMHPLVRISRALCKRVGALRFAPPVAYVYNPLDYAREPHEAYLVRWGTAPRRTLLLGMNPGPFGMAQSGVPFGDVALVRDFLGVTGKVGRPDPEHEKRPVTGFACARSEVSGARLWGWAKARFETPEAFFERFFVVNYCPLAFLETGAKNLTPDKLPAREQAALFDACDEALRETVRALGATQVVGIGAFAEKRARAALGEAVTVSTILHPSPASPRANRGWAEQIERQLRESGVLQP